MGMTPEGHVKRKVKAILDAHGIWYFNPFMSGYGRAGIPDFICCMDGKFIGIECKAGDNEPTALQTRELEAIAANGGFTFVVRESNMSELDKKLLWLKGPK